jgi:predicted aldo/keto reductase-like oxidoreductase
MQYKEYGKTGVKVSALGFGTMRLPNRQHTYHEKSVGFGFRDRPSLLL